MGDIAESQALLFEREILSYRKTLERLPDSPKERLPILTDIGCALYPWRSVSGESREKLITLYAKISSLLRLIPGSEEVQASLNNDLADILLAQFLEDHETKHLERAVTLNREALNLTSPSHRDRPSALFHLAKTILVKYTQTKQLSDLQEAVNLHRDCLKIYPDGRHTDQWKWFHGLGEALFAKVAHMEGVNTKISNAEVLEEAEEVVACFRQALELSTPSEPERWKLFRDLASAIQLRNLVTKQPHDFSEVLTPLQTALRLSVSTGASASSFDLASILNSLAHLYRSRFKETPQIELINNAILCCKKAIELSLGYFRGPLHHGLAVNLSLRYQHSRLRCDLEDSHDAFRTAVDDKDTPAHQRFDFAKSWINVADMHPIQQSFEAYDAAIALLPQLVSHDMDVEQRYAQLTAGFGLGPSAASSAIQFNMHDKAVAFLEKGRLVFWSQALQLRTSLKALESVDPDLAKKFKDLSTMLEKGSQRNTLFDGPEAKVMMEKDAFRCKRLHDDWTALLGIIRKLKNFEDFFLPIPIERLRSAAYGGPIVILNASKSGCDALIVSVMGVKHVALDRVYCTVKNLEKSSKKLHSVMKDIRGASGQDFSSRGSRQWWPWNKGSHIDPDECFRAVLAFLWKFVVQPIFKELKLEKTESPSRLWWCPTGPFSFLPLHAAGIYHFDKSLNDTVFDYVIPSHTTSLTALLEGRRERSTGERKIMVVIDEALFCAKQELDVIRKHAYSKSIPIVEFGIGKIPPTVSDVLSELRKSDIVHFACHGRQEKNPLESGLYIDYKMHLKLKMSEFIKENHEGSLAFLCACETATGAESLPDEVMHLAASLMFSGFRGVVGTMWSISDEDGPRIADTFYEHYLKNRKNIKSFDSDGAAQALHHAVLGLREQTSSFQRWVPFIHMGI